MGHVDTGPVKLGKLAAAGGIAGPDGDGPAGQLIVLANMPGL